MRNAIFLMMTIAAASSVALADPQPQNTFTYRVKVPADTTLTCAGHASSIAALFASETGLQTVNGACQSTEMLTEAGQQYPEEVLIITYTADTEVQPYQAVLGGDTFLDHSDASSSLFPTYAACLSELSTLSAQFATETGFAPVDAHCDAATLIGDTGYTLTVEGFGQPTKGFYGYTEDATIEGSAFAADVVKAAISSLTQAGADIAYTDATHVYYFAKYDPTVTEEYIGDFSVTAQCSSQAATAQAIFTQAGLTGAQALCEPFGSASAQGASLIVVGAGMATVDDNYEESPAYSSYDECAADLPRLVANASQGGGATVYGGLCAPSEDANTGFQAHVYSTY